MLRVLGATALILLLHALFVKEKVDKKDLPFMALCAVFGVAVNQLFFFMGLEKTSAMHASLIMITTPIIVLIASYILLKSKILLRQVIGILLGLVGSYILVRSAGSQAGEATVLGDIYIFINASSYAIYLVLVKRLMKKYHAITVVKWLFIIGTVMIVPFGMPDLLNANFAAFELKHWWTVAYVIVGVTFLTYVLNGYALSKVKPSTVSFYIYFQPLIASFLSIFLGQDELDFTKIQAAILMFIGVYLVIQKVPKKAHS